MHRHRPLILLGAALLAAALAAPPLAAAEPTLEAGFATRSLVTEQRGISLAGYGGRGLLPSRGVRDETMLKVMVLRTQETAFALVATDLIGVQATMFEALQTRGLPDGVGLSVDRVLITASHTHAGYGNLATFREGLQLNALFFATCGPLRKPFFDEVVEKLRAALADAWADLKPARLGVGSALVDGMNHNRGGVKVVDRELGVIKVTAPDGRLRGLIANFAAHPTILGGDNFLLSAGWPGAYQRALEAKYPGATVMFTNGAEGDQTIDTPPGEHPDVWAKVEAAGRRFAEEVDRIQQALECRGDVRLAAGTRPVEMLRPPEPEFARKAGGAPSKSLFAQAVIGDLLLMGLPGEACAQIGLDLKAAAKARGFRHAFVLGLCQDHLGYFVHASNYTEESKATHDYEKSLNFYGPGIGAFFADVHMRRFDPHPLTAAAATPLPAATPAPAGSGAEEF